MQQCVSPPPAVHALTARVSSHAWLDGAHTSVRARLQPCMACSRASPVMHGWTDYMHQWESASTAMHGLLARVAIHTWLDGHTCISVSPPPAMRGLTAHVSSHAWLDGAHASVRARLQPCVAWSRASLAMHGWMAHVIHGLSLHLRLPFAPGQEMSFYHSNPSSYRLPKAYGWSFGGPDALWTSWNDDEMPIGNWKGYPPFPHIAHQVCHQRSRESVVPRTSNQSASLRGHFEQLAKSHGTPAARHYMARGVRLEIRVYARSVEDAFNLAVHKMRLIVANDLDFLVVPHRALMESFHRGREMLRSHVRVKHISRELNADEVRRRSQTLG